VDGQEKEIGTCELLWSKPRMAFVDRAPTWESGIVGSKNGAGVNEQHWR
jgi:hypothetical protein